jgi:predicted GNAT superfamily acetyltransferase
MEASMLNWFQGEKYQLQIVDQPEQMTAIEELQRIVWPGNETEIVPAHLLITFAHNGGFVIGAFYIEESNLSTNPPAGNNHEYIPPGSPLVGFVYSFPGLYQTADGPKLKHSSHQMGVHPDHRSHGLGFALKRAQWQMVRNQGIDRITWTYDPLMSRNAYLNISKLGAVCNTYMRDVYGHLRDGLNFGIATDRFQVDWWTNSTRVNQRLSKNARGKLDLAHFLSAGAEIVNPTYIDQNGLPHADFDQQEKMTIDFVKNKNDPPLLLVEIPEDFLELKARDMDLAVKWRMLTRSLFEFYFEHGYYLTDFIHLTSKNARSFYVLSDGNSTL